MAVLILPNSIKWDFIPNTKRESNSIRLGDNYSLSGVVPKSDRISYNIVIPNLSEDDKDDLVSILKSYQGTTIFQWQPSNIVPLKDFVCSNLKVTNQSVDVWEINLTFNEIK